MKRHLVLALGLAVGIGSLAIHAQQAPSQRDDAHASSHASVAHGSFSQGGKSQQFGKGDKLPSQFRGNDRVVSNYSDNHLRQPPRGYHWVRDDGGNFVLVAITTGVISEILSGQ
jgi:Ni/Co efflux regulator RcnB